MENFTENLPTAQETAEVPVLEGQIGMEEWLKTRAAAAPSSEGAGNASEKRKEEADPLSGDGWEDDNWVPESPEPPAEVRSAPAAPPEKPSCASLSEAIAKYSSALTDADREKALHDMELFAENGDIKACLLLGRNYSPYAPNGFVHKEEQASLQWFEKAASLGSARGANEAAFLLYRGSSAIQNPELALKYAETAVWLEPDNDTYLRNRNVLREQVKENEPELSEAVPEAAPTPAPLSGEPEAAAPTREAPPRKRHSKRLFSWNLFRKRTPAQKEESPEREARESASPAAEEPAAPAAEDASVPAAENSVVPAAEESPAAEETPADTVQAAEDFLPGDLGESPAEDMEATQLSAEDAEGEEAAEDVEEAEAAEEPEPLPSLEEAVRRYNQSLTTAERQDAVLVIEKIAQQGDVRACLLLANSYLPKSPTGFPHRSERKALRWYQKASELGSGKGANEAASLFFSGSPEVRDPAAAYPYSLRSIQLNPENEVYQKNFEVIRTRLLQQNIRPKTMEEVENAVSEPDHAAKLERRKEKRPARTKRKEYVPSQVRNETLLAESEEGRLFVFDVCCGVAIIVLAILFSVRGMFAFLIPLGVLAALLIWVNLQMSGCHLCLYENYITGRCSYGRDVCIPIRSITSIGTNVMGAVRIASPHSVSSFYLIKNTDDFLRQLNQQVTKVQETDS